MDDIYGSDDVQHDFNSSSNASVNEYLASIRKNKTKDHDSSKKSQMSVLSVNDDFSAVSSNNTSSSQKSVLNNNNSKKSINESYNDIEVDVESAYDEVKNQTNNRERKELASKKSDILDVDINIDIKEDEEEEIKQQIIENIKAIKPAKKKKKKKNASKNGSNLTKNKKKHSLYDPEEYQKKIERLKAQQEKWMSPPIKKKKKEIDEMVDRLSKPSPRFDVQIPDNLVQKKPPSDPKIFGRLFEMSTEKEKKNEEKRKQKEKDENLLKSPKSNPKSLLLAEKMLLKFVEGCFNLFPKDIIIDLSEETMNNTATNTSSFQNENENQNQNENESENKKENENKNNNENNNGNDLSLGANENNNYYFKNELTREELDELLINLGLRSRKENIPKFNKILFEKMNDWVLKEKQDGNRTYDAVKIHDEMIHVIKEGEFSFSPFDRFARQRIIIALANLKQFGSLSKSSVNNSTNESLMKPSNESISNNENESEESTSFQSQKKIQYKSLIRLSQSKRKDFEPPDKNKKDDEIKSLSIRPRPKFVMNPYSEELEPACVSAKTEKIFQKSEVAHIPFVDRDQFFTEKRRKMIEQMSQESNKSQLMKFEHKPKFSQEVRNELNEYKVKKEKMKNKRKEDEPTYHPKIMNYDKYKKTIHKEMTEKRVRPEGWDNDITRHRVAYQKYLQEKLAKEREKEHIFDMMDENDIVSKYKL